MICCILWHNLHPKPVHLARLDTLGGGGELETRGGRGEGGNQPGDTQSGIPGNSASQDMSFLEQTTTY